MIPVRYRIADRFEETADTVSLTLAPVGEPLVEPRPGQFTMMYAFGIGEVPISVSGVDGGHIVQTVRAVGCVTRALCALTPGRMLGLRGPFGVGWRVPAAAGADLVVIGGGIGLAPLRPIVEHALANRERYAAVSVLAGARSEADLLFQREGRRWREAGAEVLTIVDSVGLVTTLLDRIEFDPRRTAAFACGPEVMMRAAAVALAARGVPPEAIQVSLERNMKCGTGTCGHCQLGPILVCRDGPVVGYDFARSLTAVADR